MAAWEIVIIHLKNSEKKCMNRGKTEKTKKADNAEKTEKAEKVEKAKKEA